MHAAPDALRVTDLACGYAGGTVLDGVSLALGHQEIVALIGRNGAGKTTLMRALIGVVRLDRGRIALDGVELGHAQPPARARAGIGYVPQGREVFTGLTVAENLQVGLNASRDRRNDAAMVERVLGYFPILRERLRQKAGSMSGGEQQQLAIARALVSAPRVLLLDEPSEGVQPSIVHRIGQTLAQIARELRVAVLLVEQDIALVEQVADRCCVMDKGRIVETLRRDQLADVELMRRHLAL